MSNWLRELKKLELRRWRRREAQARLYKRFPWWKKARHWLSHLFGGTSHDCDYRMGDNVILYYSWCEFCGAGARPPKPGEKSC